MYIRYTYVHQFKTRNKAQPRRPKKQSTVLDIIKPRQQYCRNNTNSRDNNTVNMPEVLTPPDIT